MGPRFLFDSFSSACGLCLAECSTFGGAVRVGIFGFSRKCAFCALGVGPWGYGISWAGFRTSGFFCLRLVLWALEVAARFLRNSSTATTYPAYDAAFYVPLAWVSADGWLIEWYFRLTAASVAESFLQLMGGGGPAQRRTFLGQWASARSRALLLWASHPRGNAVFRNALNLSFSGRKGYLLGALCLLTFLAWVSNIIRVSTLCWAAAEWGAKFFDRNVAPMGRINYPCCFNASLCGAAYRPAFTFSKSHEF